MNQTKGVKWADRKSRLKESICFKAYFGNKNDVFMSLLEFRKRLDYIIKSLVADLSSLC